jgi:transcriptional regulator with XRE-family HTH domain
MSAKSPDHIDMEVGQRIRIYRKTRGLSQTALADQLGVTFQQVQKYENGKNRIGAGRLTRIAQVLDVPVATLLGVSDITKIKSSKRGKDSSPLELLTVSGALPLLRGYERINDGKIRRSIRDLVQSIATLRR